MSTTQTEKSPALNIRIKTPQRALIERAAMQANKSISDLSAMQPFRRRSDEPATALERSTPAIPGLTALLSGCWLDQQSSSSSEAQSDPMGVNAIVIAGNPGGLSLERFGERLAADPWGRLANHRQEGRLLWEAFDWQNASYLSWLTGPRWRYLGLDPEESASERRHLPDPGNPVQITFLKTMLAVERITGGTIHVGIDVVGYRLPEDAAAVDDAFRLPPLLDDWIDDWRSAARLEPSKPGLIC